jgi:hypothetical protein
MQSSDTQTSPKMNITIETPARRKSGFTGKRQSPNQSLSARINNLQRSCDSKANHLATELNNFELWAVNAMPPQMYQDTYPWRDKHHRISILLANLAEELRTFNNTKPVYVIPSPLKNTP